MAKDSSPSPSPSPLEERERETNFSEIPPMSRKDFNAMAEMRAVPTECANWFWNTNDARNWLDSQGQAIRKVEPLLLNAAAKWRQKQSTMSTQAQPSGAAELILRSKELDRVESRLKEIRQGYESHEAMSPEHRKELAAMKARRIELKKILGMSA